MQGVKRLKPELPKSFGVNACHSDKMRITIVQHGGDYREAWDRFEGGGKATYQAQWYSITTVASLAARYEQVSVICATTNEPYDIILPNRVRAIGGGLRNDLRGEELIPLVRVTSPSRLILVTPALPLLKWAHRNHVRTLATLADSFRPAGILSRLRNRAIARALNQDTVEWVGNHGISACLSLLNIGVQPDKIIPWDWPPAHMPSDYPVRSLEPSGEFKLLYVGAISEAKGVGDVIRALKSLGCRGFLPSLTILGSEPDGSMRELASRLGVLSQVTFAGLVPNEDVPALMRSASAVVIPSRHEYPEGLPLTIYEALASRTPIIASDHPMFKGALSHERTALVFPQRNPEALASAVQRLASDADLYSTLSHNSAVAWQALQLPVVWGALIERWLSGQAEDQNWMSKHRLNSGLYGRNIAS